MKFYRFLMIMVFIGFCSMLPRRGRQRLRKNRKIQRSRGNYYRGNYGYGGYPYIASPYFYPGPASWWGPGLWGYGDYYQNYDYGYCCCGPSFNIGFNVGCGC